MYGSRFETTMNRTSCIRPVIKSRSACFVHEFAIGASEGAIYRNDGRDWAIVPNLTPPSNVRRFTCSKLRRVMPETSTQHDEQRQGRSSDNHGGIVVGILSYNNIETIGNV